MVYVFKKLNSLSGTSPTPNGDVIGDSSSNNNQTQADPHASTYQNPSKIYQANLGENLGKLDNGITKNISDTQNNLSQSSDEYKSNLNNVDSNYKYNGQSDLQNISDPNTFSRLNSLVNPASEQSNLNSIQSNTKNYNPDTSGLAASSTISGLSSQLKNQYGTTEGGSRLDAQLYRGSGQAGKAINDNLNQLDNFQADKTNRLSNETSLLNQYNQGAVDKSNQLKADGTAYQTQLQSQAADQTKQQQSQYDTQRQQGIDSLTNQRNSVNVKQQLQDAINKGFGDRTVVNQFQNIPNMNIDTASRLLQESGIPGDMANQLASKMQYSNSETPNSQGDGSGQLNGSIDLTDYLKNQLTDKFSSNVDLSSIDPSQYVSAPQTYDQNSYIDPRYNQISQLLGTNQITPNNQNYTPYSTNTQGFTDAINGYLNPQISQAQQAVEALFNKPGPQSPDNMNPYLSSAVGIISNPYLANAMLAGPTGGLNLTPGGQRIQNIVQQNLGGAVQNVGGKIDNLIGSVGSGLGIGGW